MDVFLFFWTIFSTNVEKEWTAAQESVALSLSPKTKDCMNNKAFWTLSSYFKSNT